MGVRGPWCLLSLPTEECKDDSVWRMMAWLGRTWPDYDERWSVVYWCLTGLTKIRGGLVKPGAQWGAFRGIVVIGEVWPEWRAKISHDHASTCANQLAFFQDPRLSHVTVRPIRYRSPLFVPTVLIMTATFLQVTRGSRASKRKTPAYFFLFWSD